MKGTIKDLTLEEVTTTLNVYNNRKDNFTLMMDLDIVDSSKVLKITISTEDRAIKVILTKGRKENKLKDLRKANANALLPTQGPTN